MIPLCVTADDYGLSAGVNRGIESLARGGRISGASVMCHADAAPEGAPGLSEAGVACGVHLVLVEERPLLGAERLGPFADEHGRLPSGYRELFLRVLRHPRDARLLAAEAEAQLERFLDLGLEPRFLNSHQHVHLFPPLWAALGPVFARAPRAALRVGPPLRAVSSLDTLLGASSQLARWIRPARGRALLRAVGVDAAGHLDAPRLERLLGGLRGPPARGRYELVVHPGHEDRELLNRYPHWRYRWQRELELLEGEAFEGLLARAGFALEAP